MSDNSSEFTCETVRVFQVLKHPNADRLEIVKFSWADGSVPEYQVVVGKEEFKVDDVALYISDDAMVPVNKKCFEFLKTRLDYKQGDTYYRIRAAKIRQMVSTGLLIPIETKKVGLDCSTTFGVIRYVNPNEESPLDSGEVTRRTGHYLFRWLRNITRSQNLHIPDFSVTSLRKVPKLFEDGEMVVVTEKVHGSNIRFGKVKGRLLVGSHHTIKTDNRNWLVRKLFPRKGTGSWYGEDIFTAWAKVSVEPMLREFPDNVVFYGEIFGVTESGKKIQDLTYGRTRPGVVTFAAWDLKTKRWLSMLELYDALPAHLVQPPTLFIGEYIFDSVKGLAEGYTRLMDSCPHIREGCVVASMDGTKRGKWVSENYLTRKK